MSPVKIIRPSPTSALPTWVYRWLQISSFICLIDGSFCVLRPHSLPGGCLEMIYYPYQWYIIADKNYANAKDVFIWTQGFGNLVESSINLMVVFGFFKSIQNAKIATIVVSAMTAWKTFLFSVYSLEIPTGHVVESWLGELMVFGMGAIWFIMPLLAIWELSQHFVSQSMKPSGGDIVKSQDVTKSRSSEILDNIEDVEEDESDLSSSRRYNLRRR